MQTEKAKSSHFDRTRGDKKQIFPTLIKNKDLLLKKMAESQLILSLTLIIGMHSVMKKTCAPVQLSV